MNDLLPPPEPPKRPFPWKPLVALLVPAAAFAGAVGAQRLFDEPLGDALLRWLIYATVLGVVLGFAAGAAFRRRALWTAWGAASPALIAFAIVAIASAVRPLREKYADHGVEKCRAEGRKICSLREFTDACRVNAQAQLGAPEHKACDAAGCTFRWTYAGPWRPENYVEPGAVLCSVVADSTGKPVKFTVMPGAPRD